MNEKNKARKKVISCGALTYRYGKTWEDTAILLVKQFSHKETWGIPKGHINAGETFRECAIRETREEAGIQVALGPPLKNVVTSYKNEEKTVMSFLARQVCSNKPSSNDPESEVADARWFKVSALPKIQAYQATLIDEGINLIKSFRDGVDVVNESVVSVSKIEARIKEVYAYASHVDDWISIKKELLKGLNANDRKAFSTRHPITKKQQTNDYERSLAEKWSSLSGRAVIFSKDDDKD